MLLPWTASRGAMSHERTRQSETMVPYSSISFYLKLALQSLLGRAAPCGQGVTLCHPGIGDNSSVVCFGAARLRQLCPQKEMTGVVQCPKQTPRRSGGRAACSFLSAGENSHIRQVTGIPAYTVVTKLWTMTFFFFSHCKKKIVFQMLSHIL